MPPDGSDRAGQDFGSGGVYVEFSRVGNAMKVSVIDAGSGAEAFVLGPLTASRADMQALAIAKLRRQMGLSGGSADDNKNPPPVTRRGIIV